MNSPQWKTLQAPDRLPLPEGGFDPGLVRLSAIHTHLATLALPLLLGLAARYRPRRLTGAATGIVLSAFPLVAVGVIGSPRLAWWGGWALAVGGVATAVWQLRLALWAGPALPGWRRGLLGASSASLLGAMALAATFAGSAPLGWPILDRGTMLAFHGGLAAAASGLGLAGWALRPGLPPFPAPEYTPADPA